MHWHAEEITVKGNRILLKKPAFRASNGEVAFQAEKVDLSYTVYPLKRMLDFSLIVDAPLVALTSKADLSELSQWIEEGSEIVSCRSKIQCREGMIELKDENRGKSTRIHYNFDYDNYEGVKGKLSLAFDDSSRTEHSVEIAFERDDKMTVDAEMQFHDMDGALLAQLGGIFSPKMREWQVLKGTLDGNLAFQRMKGKRPFALGHLTFKEWEVQNSKEEIAGVLPLAIVDFIADKNLKTTNRGSIELVEPAAFSFMKDGKTYFEVPVIQGALHIEGHNGTKVSFEGICADNTTLFNWGVEGNLRFFDETQSFADLTLTLNEGSKDAFVHCLYKKINGEWEDADIEVKNIGYRECHLIQEAITGRVEGADTFQLKSGVFDAKGHLFISEEGIQEIKLSKLTGRDVGIEYQPWDLFFQVENIEGTIGVNLHSQDPLRTLYSDLSVDNGRIRLNGPDGELWQLTNLQTKISVKNGRMKPSLMEGAFAGMRGTATLDWIDNALAMNLHFEGMPHGLLPMLPQVIKKGFQSEFLDDRMILMAQIIRKNHAFTITGNMMVEDQYQRSTEAINFGFDLERSPLDFSGDEVVAIKERQTGRESMHAVLPYVARPSLIAYDKWVARESGIAGYVISNGTFSAKEIPLAKYIAPFAFTADDGTPELLLSGKANFEGQFDHTGLSLFYNGDDIVMEGEDFVLNTGNDEDKTDPRALAQYHLDFNTMQHYGTLPVKFGTYLDKPRGLFFTDVSTEMKIKNKTIHATDVECFCTGAYFTGDIEVDLSDPAKGVLDVFVAIRSIQAKVSQVGEILKHFEKPPALAFLPLEGNITQRKNGGEIVFNIRPESTKVRSKFQTQLSDGAITLSPFDVSMQELFFNIDFDDEKNKMEILDLQGVVLIGKPENVEEYTLSGEKCCFTDYANNNGVFDLWIGDRSRDILRLSGTTEGNNSEYVTFTFNPMETHFGDVHPEIFNLSLKNWSEIALLKVEFDLHLSTLLHDLQMLSRSGIFFLSDRIQQQVNALKKAKGDFHFNFDYDEGTSLFTYNAIGKDIAAGSMVYKECCLNGKVKDESWIVDQLKLDEMSLGAEIIKSEKRWRINFLGLQYGKSLLMGMEGDYIEGNSFVDGRINLLQMDLSKVEEWPSVSELIKEWDLTGNLRANGSFKIETALNDRGWHADLSLNGSLKEWGIKDLKFVDTENFSVHYLSDRGITLRHFSTGTYIKDSDQLMNSIQVEKIDHDFTSSGWDLENMQFRIPSKQLNATSQFVFSLMGEADNSKSLAFLDTVEREGSVQGNISGHYAHDQTEVTVALEDGLYEIDHVPHEFKDLVIQYDPLYMNMKGRYRIENHWPYFACTTPSSSFGRGYITFKDHLDQEIDDLSIHWKILPQEGFIVEDAVGSLCGVTVNLVRDPKEKVDDEWHHLNGSVICELPKALPLLPLEVADHIQQQEMGGTYEMTGKWAIARDEQRTGGTCFAGNIEGVDCKAKGYYFEKFKGEASYSPQQAAIHNILIEDKAGVIDISTLSMMRNKDNEWDFTIPKFFIKNFRPSLLREEKSKNLSVTRNGLVLSLIEADEIQGVLSESSTWQGAGHFTFANPPKSSLQHTIFAIPAEIITRIGLNPAVLTPIEGIVQFEIGNGKILFKKFKDVYSDSRASKFYLPTTHTPSFLDFDGNLNIQIRMKQYNFLFKIAELFTVTVKGNLEKPIYTLRKQDKKGKAEAPRENASASH